LVPIVSHAAASGENRLVVIVLRGGADGLGLVVPVADPALAAMRPRLFREQDASVGEAAHYDLDGFFSLDASLAGLMPLWQRGELAFAHAVSTPYRSRRSHFDGQDVLENGSGAPDGRLTASRDGWLNRVLGFIPGSRPTRAIAIGRDRSLILSGDQPIGSWSPSSSLDAVQADPDRLTLTYRRDPLFAAAWAGANRMDNMAGSSDLENAAALAELTAEMLNGESRIAAFSIRGWDTHRGQAKFLPRAARQFQNAILALRDGLGANWRHTLVLAMTEFGRTVRENGSAGTDHGTGGLLIMAGGRLRGGKVYGSWPGLGEGQLYKDRDLMPTADLRRYPAWALASLYGVGRSALTGTVFPGLDMGSDPNFA